MASHFVLPARQGFGCLVNWLFSCLGDWSFGRLVVWLFGCDGIATDGTLSDESEVAWAGRLENLITRLLVYLFTRQLVYWSFGRLVVWLFGGLLFNSRLEW